MSDFDAIVSLTITTNTAVVSRVGYGMPLVLSADAVFAERVRYYTSYSAAVGSGKDFAEGSGTALAIKALLSQSPRPPKVAVGRLANKPTMAWLLTPAAANATPYGLTIDGHHVTTTSDSSATATEICDALRTAITALGLAVTLGGTSTLTITANVAGAFHSVKSDDINLLAISQTMADPGVATDLNAILNAASDWYAIINPYASQAINIAIAGWTETNLKAFISGTSDSANATLAASPGGSGDYMQALESLAYVRTLPLYFDDNSEFGAAAWAGLNLPKDPGSETWKFSTLKGVSPSNLTDTQKATILAKHGNFYAYVGGVGRTTEGWTPGGEYFDTIRGIDWQRMTIQTEVMKVLTSGQKLPFTDNGVALVRGAVEGALAQGVAQGFLKADPAPSCTFPRVADISSIDRANRNLPNGEFTAYIAGAIHFVAISGTISV